MKALILFCALATVAAAQSAPEPLMHTQTTFTLNVHAPYDKALPLFGPEGERAWAGKHWDPQFVWPQPAHDVEGAVFTIQHGPFTAVWVNTAFDAATGHLQYVYVIPEIMATTIDLHLRADGASTHVSVTYTRTALTPEGNAHVEAMTEADRTAGVDWQYGIDAWLAAHP
jgi:hypothetical protein